jgi:branched-chain amino acid transport system ATP-binding protein
MLLDEPSMGCAPIVIQGIFEKIREINRCGATVPLVEQNARMALTLAGYCRIPETGRIRFEGRPENVEADGSLLESCLGA